MSNSRDKLFDYDHSERILELETVLHDILATVSLDWYMQQFSKDETPTGISSGIANKIHNAETYQRIAAVFERARKLLK